VRKIRVLIVDDAVVVRRVVSDLLSTAPDVTVVGTAANGRIALAKIAQLDPDVVTLDVEMPEMDGLETLAALRKSHPGLRVVMFSTVTERGAAATLDALALGASDYVTKPAGVGHAAEARERVRDELLAKIRACTAGPATAPEHAPPVPARTAAARAGAAGRPVELVCIAVSTGGPAALAQIVAKLPPDLPVPVAIVQHMPPIFTRLLAERLDAQSALRVREGVAGAALEPGTVWIAPGDHHMFVTPDGGRVRLGTNREPPENSCRPAADVLLRSAAEVHGAGVLAVVLTGMGTDAVRGCEAVWRAGGRVLVQDEPTSVVWGMPGGVFRAGIADEALPLAAMPEAIVRRARAGRATAGRPAVRAGIEPFS
jgi:two-component system chemotaxis response regulator CheB